MANGCTCFSEALIISDVPVPHNVDAMLEIINKIKAAKPAPFKNMTVAVQDNSFCSCCGVNRSGDWRPYIGQQVKPSYSLLESYPEYRGETYFVAEIRIERRGGYPVDGLNIAITEEWPVTSKTTGFTDGFYINRAGKPDDLEPVRLRIVDMEALANG
ncbi:hypothetical protein FHW96_002374 [Novosphingobium sp. SG751A]|uniref:hypothetical protein n=1 Tax=Novosphingobium sp. SG751A TaxID=2587000 RepID=UPI001551F93D|nr:hypothetical protein [Novosphingobium sp. SG751A]NOW46216.1 hypothetical protein [Novosphingobium sp. SG751A]